MPTPSGNNILNQYVSYYLAYTDAKVALREALDKEQFEEAARQLSKVTNAKVQMQQCEASLTSKPSPYQHLQNQPQESAEAVFKKHLHAMMKISPFQYTLKTMTPQDILRDYCDTYTKKAHDAAVGLQFDAAAAYLQQAHSAQAAIDSLRPKDPPTTKAEPQPTTKATLKAMLLAMIARSPFKYNIKNVYDANIQLEVLNCYKSGDKATTGEGVVQFIFLDDNTLVNISVGPI